MRTTIDIDPHLLKRLRAEAQRKGVSFKEMLTTILRRGLDAPVAPPRSRYRCPTHAMGVPARTFNLDKALAIARALEGEETARRLALLK